MNAGSRRESPDSLPPGIGDVSRHRWTTVAWVTALYSALTLLMTWPLVTGLTRDVPGDLGDSLLNMWILGWGVQHLPALLTGQITLAQYWNGNIFHPEPLVLGLSEHLSGEVLQILPIYSLTGNLILCYNLLFLSSFVLSGVGMFLLTRDLLETAFPDERGDARLTMAACAAGLIFAFVPLRIAQVAHIQSLQTQWMPLALFGFRRYIVYGRVPALVGGTAALIMLHLSNGYYLLYFTPLVPVFVIQQMWSAGRLREMRAWLAFGLAAAVTTVVTLPFVQLYAEAQRIHGLERSRGEVIRFSADVYSYLTAPEALRFWGQFLQAYPKAEGELFVGAVPWLLFGAGAIMTILRGDGTAVQLPRWRRRLVLLVRAVLVMQTAGFIGMLLSGGFITTLAGIPVRATNPARILTSIAVVAAVLVTVSPSTRHRVRAMASSPVGVLVVLTGLALWLSLGPIAQSRGRALPDLGLYSVLYEHVPGFDGLRVPARYAMVAVVFLAAVAGFGAAALSRRSVITFGAVVTLFIAEAAFVPMAVNLTWGQGDGITPPPRVEPADTAPPVYHTLARMPADAVVAEFPFGDPSWELRYVYYSTVHRKRLVNGYSGAFPHGYQQRMAQLRDVSADPDVAWRTLRGAGVTHVVVHLDAFAPGAAAVVTQWLDQHFAVEIARFDGDLLFDVSGVWPPR
jgi:hypothetical protein